MIKYKRIRIPIVALLLLGYSFQITAQTSTANLPQILPSSPEPTAFVKAGVGSTNLSTGAANASIPLYTIKVKDFEFPISVSYSTQGLKVDEASSRVGQGWVLNATGMITRSVRGEPDEFSQRQTLPTDYNSYSDELYYFYLNSSNSGAGYDSQPDEFQFHVNGISGKFVLDNNNTPRITSTSNIKIAVTISVVPFTTSGDISNIVITDSNGVIYHFGGAYEKTTDHNIASFSPYKLTKTAFFLDRIDLTTGEYITFNYSPINTNVGVGTTQTWLHGTIQNNGSCSPPPLDSYTSSYDRVSYNTRYLTNISTSTGINVNFNYASRVDLSGDNRLSSLEVIGLKKYNFDYYDLVNQSQQTGRFFLTKITDTGLDQGPSLNYEFSYDRLTEVPLPISFSQDYLGYYNGNSLGYFIPSNITPGSNVDFSFRDPHSNYSMIGTLTKIKYPTGGTEEFVYEANTHSEAIKINTLVSCNLNGPGGGGSGSSQPITYTYISEETASSLITIPFNQSVSLSVYAEDADPNDGYTAGSNQVTASVAVYQGTTLVASRTCLGYNLSTNDIQLAAGTYTLKMTVQSYTEIAHGSLVYDTLSYPIYDTLNIEIPGVRVKQINYFDPVANQTNTKYYTYATLSDLTKSTGSALGVSYHSGYDVRVYCSNGINNEHNEYYFEVYSSSSTNQVYSFSGSGSVIYYPIVIESDDPNFVNGGTQYTFYNNDFGSSVELAHGDGFEGVPGGQIPTLSSVLTEKKFFDNQFQIVRIEQDDYEALDDFSHEVSSVMVRKTWDPTTVLSAEYPDRLLAFDAARWYYENVWIRLKSKTVTEFTGNNTLVSSTSYFYGDPINILPDSVITLDGKGAVLSTRMKYPNTYPTNGDPSVLGYFALASKNILSPVVEETVFKDGILTHRKHIQYKDWFGNSSIVTPEIVKVVESTTDSEHDAIVYSSYDPSGNPTEVKLANNFPIVYLWDRTHNEVLCEVKNVKFSQVAYTSFECTDYGNWQINGTVNSSAAFNGQNSFSGTLQFTATDPGTYSVSLWTNGAAPTVNSASGNLVGNNSMGWNLYTWSLTNPSQITVSGTNMDEVRLLPAGAEMTTLTYKPYVGITSKTDANNLTSYFSYDTQNRLVRINDHLGNIVKQIKYHYQSGITTGGGSQ